MKKYNVAILGATGAVGMEMLKVLQERDFPIQELRLLASSRSAGKVIETEKYGSVTIQEAKDSAFEGMDIVLGAAENDISKRFVDAIKASGAEYVVLAGYMRLLTSTFLQAFPGRVINIHPAILPSFPGAHGGPDAQAYGVKITGCTVHFVEELVDSGPVIIQAAVPANAGEELDDLMNRIHPLEHRIYPQALQWLAEGRLRVEGRQVFLAPADRKTVTPDGPWLVWPPLEEGF